MTQVLSGRDGSVWAVGLQRNIYRFDGRSWMVNALPDKIISTLESATLAEDQDRAIWINQTRLRTTRYKLDQQPPETEITFSLDVISQPGNATLNWRGKDLYNGTFDGDLQYAYRLDEGKWSLNAILGYVQILDRDETLHPEQRKSIETIGQSGNHLLGLINDILDISKIEAGREELHSTDFDLKNMLVGLGGMFDIRCRQKDLAWDLNLPNKARLHSPFNPKRTINFDSKLAIRVRVFHRKNKQRFLNPFSKMQRVSDMAAQDWAWPFRCDSSK